MILTAHQPTYLPWLGLFHKIALADKFCFFDDVQYQPKDWNNRNKIKFSNGKENWLSVPVKRTNYLEKSYLDIEINNEVKWQKKHFKSIVSNYSKSEYYDLYIDEINQFYNKDWELLVDLNYEMLIFFLKKLGITTQVIRMRDFEFKGKKSDLVLNMCLQLEADTYIFGALGKNYVKKDIFLEKNVSLFFQNYVHPSYKQLHGHFIENLSIIDLLLNCGPNSLSILMTENINKEDLIKHINKKI